VGGGETQAREKKKGKERRSSHTHTSHGQNRPCRVVQKGKAARLD